MYSFLLNYYFYTIYPEEFYTLHHYTLPNGLNILAIAKHGHSTLIDNLIQLGTWVPTYGHIYTIHIHRRITSASSHIVYERKPGRYISRSRGRFWEQARLPYIK